MFKRIFGVVRCMFGKHHRSRRLAKLQGDTYYSVCEHCGVRLRQKGNKIWTVERI